MIGLPERSPERDAALAAMLPHVPFTGWGMPALRQGLQDLGADRLDAELLFPGGTTELIEAFADLIDRQMEAGAEALDLPSLRVPARVRALIALRLHLLAPHREAVRRALSLLALPRLPIGLPSPAGMALAGLARAPVAARITARTVDAIWHAAGDTSADFNWYTKRATLAGVYASTLLFWLGRHDEDDAATLAFLDRRLAGVAAFGKAKRRCQGLLGGRLLSRFTPRGHQDAAAA